MTVKIVKPPPSVYKTTCTRCGAVYEYELEDVRPLYGAAGGYQGVWCPACQEFHHHFPPGLFTGTP